MKQVYILPSGKKAFNMKDARELMGLSAVAFRSLVRKGIVIKKTETTNKQMQQGYEPNNKTTKG